jgi:Fe-S oxidoreductase
VSEPLDELREALPATLDCVHCGLCLPACPTYRVTGRETSSPRGRVYLMRGVAEGTLPLEALAEEASLCLGCRACETACPSGVAYGSLLEHSRAALTAAGHRDAPEQKLERFALRQVVERPRRLALAVAALAAVQRLGLDRLARPLLPARLREAQALLPKVPPARERRRLPVTTRAPVRRGRVAFFEGCIMPELFGPVNRAAVRVLARNGFDVVVPRDQGCCGALHLHAGDREGARALAARNALAFDPAEVDAVIVASAGCGAALRDMALWAGPDAEPLAGKIRDVCEFLDEAGIEAPTSPVEGRVCYDDPCHLVHAQGVESAPRRLLAAIPGLELVAHDDPGACCGAAGTYNLTRPEMAAEVLERKMASLCAGAPDWIATGNPGCLMQLAAGARARRLRADVVHPLELLDRAYSR